MEESKQLNTKRLCACGSCNEFIDKYDKWRKERHYKLGHYKKGGRYVKGEKNWNWKGGKTMNSQGYVLVYKPGHPRARGKSGYVHEAVLILEQKLGRSLRQDEEPHHINKIKTDNSQENLMVMTHSEHTIIHNKIDMSNRKCYDCDSKTTTVDWYKVKGLENEFRCTRCYHREYYKRKGTKPISSDEGAD